MKFPHSISTKLVTPSTFNEAKISPRILSTITSKFDWFYKAYYPSVDNTETKIYTKHYEDVGGNAEVLIRQLEQDIKKETT
jgi:hypothetical protein